jgi:glucose-6-phosphate 1-dehydrogenase
MSPVEITPEFNPLRLPSDRRLNRIAGPSSLIIFGVTGDLSRKKLMPAVYDLANRGLLPPGFSLVGFARRDWEDQDFEKVVYDAVKQYARTPFEDDVWKQLAQGARPRARHDGQPRVLPVHPAEGVPARHRAAQEVGARRPVR